MVNQRHNNYMVHEQKLMTGHLLPLTRRSDYAPLDIEKQRIPGNRPQHSHFMIHLITPISEVGQ